MSNRREQNATQDLGSSLGASTGAAIDQMIRWPFWFTGATMDLVLQGMQRMTGPTNWAMGSQPQSGAFGANSGRNMGTSRSSGNGVSTSEWTSWSGQSNT